MTPVGPLLDAEVLKAQGLEAWGERLGSTPPFSTDRAWAMELLELLAIGASIEIAREYDEEDDLAGGEGDRWIVRADGDECGGWYAEGQGKTLAEAVCRNAVHFRDE